MNARAAIAALLVLGAVGMCVSQNICRLPSDAGRCLANVPSYFFNSATGRCEKFIYGGCGGNANRFETVAQCEQRCLRS